MFDANACAIELLKMKNSEDIQQKVAATSSFIPQGDCVEATLKTSTSTGPDMLKAKCSSSVVKQATDTDSSERSNNHCQAVVNADVAAAEDPSLQENSVGVSSTSVGNETESISQPKTTSESLSNEPLPSGSTGVLTASNNNNNNNHLNATATTSSTTSVTSLNEDGDRMTIDSSSEDEDEIYLGQFTKESMGSGNNDPSSTEEAVIKRNTSYLIQRYTSLMHRVQGIMQVTAARHISKQLKSVLEYPGLNQSLAKSINCPNRMKSSFKQDTPSENLTKQGISELQFCAKLMTNIVRHSMCNQLNLSNDSGTEDSDTDDEEVVLPDERLVADPTISSGRISYLPVENNPFIDAIKLEKQYDAKRTSIDCSLNECEFSLTKSLALRKHCKASKPLFQLKKPATSSNVINIPVDAASSVKFYHDRRPVMTRRCIDFDDGFTNSNSDITSLGISRVSDMMQEQDKVRTGTAEGNGVSGSEQPSSEKKTDASNIASEVPVDNTSNNEGARALQDPISKSTGEEGRDQNPFIPSLKKVDSGGVSVLGVEFVNNSDPNQSSSRCSAIKRPDKNRKVFQLGGIQNIFRDPTGLPTVSCTCFGRNELCALCLGRSQRKTAITHAYMDRRDKVAILDETFHRTLSFSDDVPFETLVTSRAVESAPAASMPKSANVQQIIKNRSRIFPPDFLETGPKPKKPRLYDIKPHVESPVPSPKKENRFSDETIQSIRKRMPRKSQSSFEEREGSSKSSGKGLGWPARERKDSMRRTRNQEFDIDNIVIPYSIAAATRVEQLVYKPIETPRWRVLDYSEIFSPVDDDKISSELEDMSNAAFLHRHNKCEVDEKKRYTTSLQKALSSTRKTRRLDSTCRSESSSDVSGLPCTSSQVDTQLQPTVKPQEKDVSVTMPSTSADDQKGPATPVTDNATVITEAMATQALKSLFKIQRRRTISTSTKPEEEEVEPPPEQIIDPWPQRKFPLPEEEYKVMVETMQQCDLPHVRKSQLKLIHNDDPLASPPAGI